MLSYRHSFHAGNFADVLKHIVLLEILHYMLRKDKALTYVDTHAGAGLYRLESAHADKLREHEQGVSKIMALEWPELQHYQNAVQAVNRNASLKYYPGSPIMALNCLRPQDSASLFELHPEDIKLLTQNTREFRKARVNQTDGLRGLLGVVPPESRRGVILIDPSYEIKSDYDAVVHCLEKAHRKFATGTYALWYPVVDRERINRLEKKLSNSGIRHIQLFELGLREDGIQQGMTSSGMIVINPPWPLKDTMNALLPRLVDALDETGQSFYRSETLVEE